MLRLCGSARPSGRARIETRSSRLMSGKIFVAPVLRDGRGLKLAYPRPPAVLCDRSARTVDEFHGFQKSVLEKRIVKIDTDND